MYGQIDLQYFAIFWIILEIPPIKYSVVRGCIVIKIESI